MGNFGSCHILAIEGSGFKYLEVFLKVFVQLHNRRHIPASVVVVWSRPHCHQFLIKHIFITLHHQLMGTRYQAEPIVVAKLLHSVLSENVSSAPP